MYHEIGGHLIWLSDSKPHWKEWRGKVVYRQRNERMAAISSGFDPGNPVHQHNDIKPD